MGVSNLIGAADDPVQAYAMDKTDIANVRRWHREAALRAKRAGFDIVHVYAGHSLPLPMRFLSRRYNDRIDEYGGSLKNRSRLLREMIEDTKDAVGDTCAVAVRLATDELIGIDGITVDESLGRNNTRPNSGRERPRVITPDDIIDGADVSGPVVIFDDDHYYRGGVPI